MGRHTGEQILRNPTLALAVTKCLQQGSGIVDTASTLKVSQNSVRAVRDTLQAEPTAVDQWNKALANGYQSVLERQVTEYASALESGKINPNNLPLHMGILLDKRAMLLESPTQSKADTDRDLDSTLDRLKALRPQVNVQVNVNSDPRTQKEDKSIDLSSRPKDESSPVESETTDSPSKD